MSHRTQQPDDPGTDAPLRTEVADLRAEIAEMQDEMAEMAEEIEELRAERDDLRAEIASQSDRIQWAGETRHIEDLRIDGIPVGRAISMREEEIAELREEIGEAGVSPDTELGVALQLPAEVRADRYGVAEQRAITIARQIRSVAGNFGAKVDKRLMRCVERERDESIAWAQLYRACEALESLADGGVTFVERDDDTNRLRIDDASVLP
jgi:predicted RNase H-like nuclease (RuvC/YqgF family)